MSMQLRQKEVILDTSGTRKITVVEAGWDYSFRYSELEKALEKYLSSEENLANYFPDASTAETFKFFCKNYYPFMASCVIEGEVPAPEEAFALPRMYLDNWYLTVWELNEDIIGSPCPKTIEHEEVFFRDGSKLIVWEAKGLPSFLLKLVELEEYASQHPLEGDPQGQIFASLFYPKMAASCNGHGEVPDSVTVRNWPRSEIQKWMEASRRLNPEWYAVKEAEEERVSQERKKKVRKRSAG